MADLLDIVPATAVESVHVSTGRITVRGLTGPEVASVLGRFPHLLNLVRGFDAGMQALLQFGQAIGPIIAIACGHPNDEKYEQAAAKFLAEDQLKLLNSIMQLSFPNGMVSFVNMVTTFVMGTDGRDKPVKMRLKKSPSVSPPSSAEDSPQIMQ